VNSDTEKIKIKRVGEREREKENDKEKCKSKRVEERKRSKKRERQGVGTEGVPECRGLSRARLGQRCMTRGGTAAWRSSGPAISRLLQEPVSLRAKVPAKEDKRTSTS